MGIIVTEATTKPAITYDRIHVLSLEIKQPVFTDDTQVAGYRVVVFFQYYGLEGSVRHYLEEVHSVSIPNYLVKAIGDAEAGDSTLLNALSNIELAVSKILAEELNITTSIG